VMREDLEGGFEPAEAPLFRLTLIHTAEQSYLFVFTYHHLILDRASLHLILKEGFAIYEALSREKDVRLNASLCYKDYIVWLKKQDRATTQTFWRQALEGFIAPAAMVNGPLAVPSALPAGHGQEQLELPAAATESLREFQKKY